MKKKKIIVAIIVIAVVVILIAIIRNKAKKNSIQNIPSTTISGSSIPSQVMKEDPSDWEGDILTYQGVKYTPVNGVWTIV